MVKHKFSLVLLQIISLVLILSSRLMQAQIWNGDRGLSCDFIGNDLQAPIQATVYRDCVERCQNNYQCTHFTWSSLNGGICTLKKNCVSKSNAVAAGEPDTNKICGIIDRIVWTNTNVNWAYCCEFTNTGSTIASSVQPTNVQCSTQCAQTPYCTHFIWNATGSNICELKKDFVAKLNADYKYNPSQTCGFFYPEVRLVQPSRSTSSFVALRNAQAYLQNDFDSVVYSELVAKNGAINVWRDYYGGTPQERADDIMDAILNSRRNTIIWSMVGGRNSAEIFEILKNYSLISKNNNRIFLIGYSDITALHYYFSNFYPNSIRTVHANMGQVYYANTPNAAMYALTKRVIDGEAMTYTDLEPLNDLASQVNLIDNTSVLGGNLALTQRSIGTLWEPNFDGKIIVLEEIGETIAETNKFLNHLKNVGLFNKAKAVVFGQFYYSIGAGLKENKNVFENEDNHNELLTKNAVLRQQLQDLIDHYNQKGYLSVKLVMQSTGEPTFHFLDLESKINVEALSTTARVRMALQFYLDDSVTRLEASLLHFYQAKYIPASTELNILWMNVNGNRDTLIPTEQQNLDNLRVFARGLNLPAFKSNSFGHKGASNSPLSFGTYAKLGPVDVTKSRFYLEMESPFKP